MDCLAWDGMAELQKDDFRSRRADFLPGGRVSRRWRGVLLTTVAALGLSVAAIGPAFAVANGEPVAEGQYRFSVKLTMPDITRPDGSHYSSACSAALIAPQWIISAGHCFHDGARNPISGPVRYPVVATLGTADVNSGNGQNVDVLEVQQAPDRDIAVARLARPVSGVPWLRLNEREPKPGDTVRIAGWGWTAEEGTEPAPSTTLWTGKFTISSVTGTIVGVKGLSPESTTSSCPWDSGAPYFTYRNGRAYLVSVENTGPDCPHDQEETTARVDTLRSWILDTIG